MFLILLILPKEKWQFKQADTTINIFKTAKISQTSFPGLKKHSFEFSVQEYITDISASHRDGDLILCKWLN